MLHGQLVVKGIELFFTHFAGGNLHVQVAIASKTQFLREIANSKYEVNAPLEMLSIFTFLGFPYTPCSIDDK